MARKKDDELIEDQSVSFGVVFKVSFLIIMIAIGVFFLSRFPRDTKKNAAEIEKSQTIKAIRGMKLKVIEFVGDSDKRGEMVKDLQNTGDDVLGTTAKVADAAVEKSTDTLVDVIYEHTLEKVIQHLVDRLPERQKDNYIKRLCTESSCPDTEKGDK